MFVVFFPASIQPCWLDSAGGEGRTLDLHYAHRFRSVPAAEKAIERAQESQGQRQMRVISLKQCPDGVPL